MLFSMFLLRSKSTSLDLKIKTAFTLGTAGELLVQLPPQLAANIAL